MAEKTPPPIKEEGAPEWMVTFSDCMTLLLTFFVLLLSFSSFEKQKFDDLAKSLSTGMPGMSPKALRKFVERKSHNTPADKGSTAPTQADKPTDNTIKQTEPENYRQLKVFTADSEDFFLSNGKSLSSNGKQTLDLIAKFLKNIPCRVIITEVGQSKSNNPMVGLPRSYEILNYLTKNGIPTQMLNISSANTLHQNINIKSQSRQVQITLLERDIYEP